MRVVITAGPTREPFDPIRYLSNRSSGRMGYALARASIAANHDTTLISGPVSLRAPRGARMVQIVTGADLQLAMHEKCAGADLVILCAAVCDFRPRIVAEKKLPRVAGTWNPELVPTPDLAAELGAMRVGRPSCIVAFAAETHDTETRAAEKLQRKQCDFIVANDVSQADSGMDSEWNAVTLLNQSGVIWRSGRMKKTSLARTLFKRILTFDGNIIDKLFTSSLATEPK